MEVIRGYSASTRAVLPVNRQKLAASIDVCLEPDEASRPVPRYGMQRRSRANAGQQAFRRLVDRKRNSTYAED